jgi:hypothetical protein
LRWNRAAPDGKGLNILIVIIIVVVVVVVVVVFLGLFRFRIYFLKFMNLFRQLVGLLGGGISPTQGLYLHRTTQT